MNRIQTQQYIWNKLIKETYTFNGLSNIVLNNAIEHGVLGQLLNKLWDVLESEVLLPCSYDPTAGRCGETSESSLHLLIQVFKMIISKLFSPRLLGLPSGCFLQGFAPTHVNTSLTPACHTPRPSNFLNVIIIIIFVKKDKLWSFC